MIFKKLFVFEYEVLFNILDEIKEYLNFEIIFVSKKNFEDIVKVDNSDYLVISKDKKNDIKNCIFFDEIPMNINRLVQTINLKFLKINLHISLKLKLDYII